MKLGTYIRLRRIKIRMSQRQLGKILGVTSQFISNVERGCAPMPMARMQPLVIALQIVPEEMLGMVMREVQAELRQALCIVPKEEPNVQAA